MRHKITTIALSMLVCFPFNTQAQSVDAEMKREIEAGTTRMIVNSHESFEKRAQKELNKYRIIKSVEEFPERPSANLQLKFNSDPTGAVLTLHDGVNGKPLETCLTPCELHTQENLTYAVTFFKWGYPPYALPLALDNVSEWRSNELPTVSLGENYYDLTKKHIQCISDFLDQPKVDGDATPCLRIPPVTPANAKKSGHCEMVFDLTYLGKTTNVRAPSCTDDVFREHSIGAVKWWRYNPKVVHGNNVPQKDIETRITFVLRDTEGNALPE